MVDLMRDPKLDEMIKDIIDIFTNVEGVELVRLTGLTRRCRSISGYNDLGPDVVDNIVRKLKANAIINYQYIMYCPHCRELTYQVKDRDYRTPKLCDTCKIIYNLIDNETLFRGEL